MALDSGTYRSTVGSCRRASGSKYVDGPSSGTPECTNASPKSRYATRKAPARMAAVGANASTDTPPSCSNCEPRFGRPSSPSDCKARDLSSCPLTSARTRTLGKSFFPSSSFPSSLSSVLSPCLFFNASRRALSRANCSSTDLSLSSSEFPARTSQDVRLRPRLVGSRLAWNVVCWTIPRLQVRMVFRVQARYRYSVRCSPSRSRNSRSIKLSMRCVCVRSTRQYVLTCVPTSHTKRSQSYTSQSPPPQSLSIPPLSIPLNPLSLTPSQSLNPSQSPLSQSLSISVGVEEAGPSGGGRTFLMAGGVGMKRLDNCEVTSLTKLLWSRVRRDFMMRTMAASI